MLLHIVFLMRHAAMRSWSGPQPNSAFLYLTAMDAMYKARPPHPRSAAPPAPPCPHVMSVASGIRALQYDVHASLAVGHAALSCWQVV